MRAPELKVHRPWIGHGELCHSRHCGGFGGQHSVYSTSHEVRRHRPRIRNGKCVAHKLGRPSGLLLLFGVFPRQVGCPTSKQVGHSAAKSRPPYWTQPKAVPCLFGRLPTGASYVRFPPEAHPTAFANSGYPIRWQITTRRLRATILPVPTSQRPRRW